MIIYIYIYYILVQDCRNSNMLVKGVIAILHKAIDMVIIMCMA